MTEPTHEALSALGRRIAVVGGGGKSTLAGTLANAIAVPHLELDAMFWKPGWVESEGSELKARVIDALHRMDDGWVCDGNYLAKLGDLVLSQADTVILVNMPWRVTVRRVLVRGIGLAMTGRPTCGNNRETFRDLISSRSLVWWHVKYRKKYLERPRQVRELTPVHTRLIQLDTPRQLDQLYTRLSLNRP